MFCFGVDVVIGCDCDEVEIVGVVVDFVIDDYVVGKNECVKVGWKCDFVVIGVGCGWGCG